MLSPSPCTAGVPARLSRSQRSSRRSNDLVQRTAVAAILLLGVACSGAEKRQPEATPVEVMNVALATTGDNALRYSAAIRPDQQVDLAFRVGGYIEQLRTVRGADGRMRSIQEGDRVTRGDVMARVRQADYDDKVAQGRAVVDEARAGYEQAKRDFDRVDALFQAKSITRPEYDGAKARLDAAEARYRNAQASSHDATLAMTDANLAAPISGIVLKRNVELGNLVSPGSAAFVIADTRRVKALFGVPDLVVEGVHDGEQVDITTDALRGAKFRGTVTRVSPSADAKARLFDVEVTIDNPDDALKPGMVAALEIASRGAAPVTAAMVPLDSVVRSAARGDDFAVFILEPRGNDAIARSRIVKLGDTAGNMIQVVDGLRSGERVVTRGASLLSDGQRVRVLQ